VKRAAERHLKLMRVACTGCGYCLPCPQGVDIPTCFEVFNSTSSSGNPRFARMFYMIRLAGVTGRPASHASLCSECGSCAPRCPQDLPIPELLSDVADEFEGIGLRVMSWLARVFLFVKRRAALRSPRRR
jgi:hypothetical protein